MERQTPSVGAFILFLIFFVLVAATAVVLLITTLVAWMAELTGSMIAARLIVSGFCFLLAAAIYLFALRAPFARLQDQIETVYGVARAAREGYEWITEKALMLLKMLKLRDLWRDR